MKVQGIRQLIHFCSLIISSLLNKIRYSTFAKLRILINLLLLGVITISVLVIFKSIETQILKFLQDTGISTIETCNEEIVTRKDEIILGEKDQLDDIIYHPEFHRIVLNQFNQVSLVESFLGMALLDKNYKLPMVPVGDFKLNEISHSIIGREIISGRIVKYNNQRVLLFLSPLKVAKASNNDQFNYFEKKAQDKLTIGYIVMLISLESLEKSMNTWSWNIAVFGLILMILTIFIHNRVFRIFLIPFEKLMAATKMIAREDYSIRLNSNRKDELGDLSNSFDIMAAQLEKNIGDLEEKHIQLQQAYKELEESKELIIKQEKLVSLGTMVAGIAHEINNPTQALKFSMESLKLDVNDIQDILLKVKEIKNSDNKELLIKELSDLYSEIDGDMLLDEMNEILDENQQSVNRIEHIVKSTKRMAYADLQLTTCSINEIIDDAVTLSYNQIKYNLNIKKSLDKNIPAIQASPQELGQVFINLIINAKDAVMEKGLIKDQSILTIKTLFSRNEDKIVIEFSDNGCGIREEVLNKIFDPFFTTKEIGQGTGLGLNLCHRIIESHNGTISVKSVLGEGTSFIITLPVNHRVIK